MEWQKKEIERFEALAAQEAALDAMIKEQVDNYYTVDINKAAYIKPSNTGGGLVESDDPTNLKLIWYEFGNKVYSAVLDLGEAQSGERVPQAEREVINGKVMRM
jgi:hypothetical protein